MPNLRPYDIHCPKCRHDWSVELHESVNVKTDPGLRDELFSNRLNAVTCPGCSFEFRVDKPLLYSDPDRRLLIYWFPAPAARRAEGEEQFADWLREAGLIMPDGIRAPEVHLVFSRIELVERIFLREAGLDERIIEYVKYLIFSRNGEKLDPVAKSLLFNVQDSTPEALCFVVLDEATRKFESVLHYQREAYQALVEAFGSEEKTADLLEMFPGPYVNARALLLEELQEQAEESELELEQEQGLEPESEEDPDRPPASPGS
jgi:hypothetical protein